MAEILLLDLAYRQSLGLRALQHELRKQGISCEIIDLTGEVRKGTKVFGTTIESLGPQKSISVIKEKLLQLRPQIEKAKFLGISFVAQSDDAAIRVPVASFLKETFPHKILIGGGPGITSDAQKFFKHAKLDYAIKGEGEKALPKLINAVKKRDLQKIEAIEGIVLSRKGKIIEAQRPALLTKQEVSRLPFITAQGDMKGEVITYTERGCPNACIFCSAPRKGIPAQLSEKTIIKGIIKLSKNPQVTSIHFIDDQLFSDKERAKRIIQKIISLKLNKRFAFRAMATVDSLLKNGQVDTEFINLIKRARFDCVWMGTESLNNNILREVKSGRYTAQQAIKVADALTAAKIKTGNFMLAGGMETRAKDFLKSYYSAMSRTLRRKSYYTQLGMIEARGKSPLLAKAAKEGHVYTAEGKVNPAKTSLLTSQVIMPKDPVLREYFLTHLKNRGTAVALQHISGVIDLSKKVEGEKAGQRGSMTRKLQKLQGRMCEIGAANKRAEKHFLDEIAFAECKRRYGKITQKTVDKLAKDKEFIKRALEKSKNMARQYQKEAKRIQQQKGIQRLHTMKRIRTRFGISGFSGMRK